MAKKNIGAINDPAPVTKRPYKKRGRKQGAPVKKEEQEKSVSMVGIMMIDQKSGTISVSGFKSMKLDDNNSRVVFSFEP